jgi:hypothetical protein
MVKGEIYGHKTIRAGTVVSSEYLREIRDKGDYFIAEGFSGRQYICYKDQHHPKNEDIILI